ncbi:MAG: T9SS type A sorting domain-containing protein [Bacteroidales bacterium]|nr:T9SS type A sorting domain-containing protein [Bacteroidales bacterium]
MKKVLFLLAIFCALTANAQNYLISFAGTGASSAVNTVKVENLMTGTTLTFDGNDILHLTATTGIDQVENGQSSALKVFPNPSIGNPKLQFYPLHAGKAVITVFDITGRKVAQIQRFLEKSLQEFQLTDLNNGFYLINIKGNKYNYSGELLSTGTANGNISIEQITNNKVVDVKQLSNADKGSLATVDMAYSTGDRLKYTVTSGIYSTAIIDIPSQDKTITANFIACTDGDNNNYPVVVIGTQTWMAENLKTTKYNDGTSVPGYCWNNYDINNKNIYGALYSFNVVNTGKLCPTGWRVPSHSEWGELVSYLGGSAGGKMKETGTTHWNSPNTGATNESGFTALPGGARDLDMIFYPIGHSAWFWSSTPGPFGAYYRCLIYDFEGHGWGETMDVYWGYSVRCIKD